jgi:hypothetical protein
MAKKPDRNRTALKKKGAILQPQERAFGEEAGEPAVCSLKEGS